MQEAIKNYIEIQSKNMIPLEKVEKGKFKLGKEYMDMCTQFGIRMEIDKVTKNEIEKVRQKQLRQWRKLWIS
jgi:hypothetical protein